jgi:hypothetical protein
LKGILSDGDWEAISPYVQYTFKQDSHFAEMKNAEVLRDRVEIAQTIDEYIGRFYSTDWIRKNVLMQTEEEVFQMDRQMKREEEGGIEGGEGEEDDDTFDGGESVDHRQPTTVDTVKRVGLSENAKNDDDDIGELINLLNK